jgi:hypothetical protein
MLNDIRRVTTSPRDLACTYRNGEVPWGSLGEIPGAGGDVVTNLLGVGNDLCFGVTRLSPDAKKEW